MYIHDIVVFSSGDKPILLVEVKSLAKKDSNWAKGFRDFVLEKTELKSQPSFLLATPERWFFFTNSSDPVIEFPVTDLTLNRIPEKMRSQTKISHDFLTTVVFDALEELIEKGEIAKRFQSLADYLYLEDASKIESGVVL